MPSRRASPLLLLALAACTEPAPPPPHSPPPPSASAPLARALTAPPPPAPLPLPEPPPSAAPEAPPPPPLPPRLTSLTHLTRIFARPKIEERYLGDLGFGDSLPLRSTEPVPGEGCRGGFYPVLPRGYVCNGPLVSLTPAPKLAELAQALAPSPGPLPFHYAYSDGVPSYNKVPTEAEWTRLEGGYGPRGDQRRLPKNPSPYDDLATLAPIPPTGPLPTFLAEKGGVSDEPKGLFLGDVPPGNMLAWSRAFEAKGRTFLLTTEHILVPADRVRPFQPSTYHGARLGGDLHLPLAFVRLGERPRHRRLPTGAFEKTGTLWPAHGTLPLEGPAVETARGRYWPTRERDSQGGALFIADKDAAVIEAETTLPAGLGADQKWIVVSLGKGSLAAYEGKTPVYATLISPGAGGAPEAGKKKHLGTTPLGAFALTYKHRFARMTHELGAHPTHYISAVPHVQYFNPPYALHAAYWHDRFGEPTSAGCINLSPLDAEALFAWSDPQVPLDWRGALAAAAPENGKTTLVVIRR
jgi:lipoprotein-anchoring transpeptidase ErfK/SrfK